MPAAIDSEHILDSVLTVWREDGYSRATTRKVAAVAGISEITLFRRFGDKPSLFRAALELEAERFSSQAIDYSGDIYADLLRIVEAYIALLNRSATIILDFLLEAPRNPEIARIRSVPLTTMGKVAVIIARYQEEGRLRDGAPFTALLALLSPLIMTALLKRAQPRVLLDFDPSAHVTSFLDGWTCVKLSIE